jgi:hypothetical protein
MKLTASLAALAIALGFGAGAHAKIIDFVQNGTFQESVGYSNSTLFDSTFNKTGYHSNAVTGWSSTGYNFVFLPLTKSSPYGGADQGSGYKNLAYGSSNDPDLYLWGYGSGSKQVSNGFKAPPGGGNFIASDDEYLAGPISQTISGLEVGQKYTLTFEEAFTQQAGYTGGTLQNWEVCFLGTCEYADNGNPSTKNSPVSVSSKGFVGWKMITMVFTATTNDLSSLQGNMGKGTLTFQSYGKDVTGTSNLPPFALLADVSLDGEGTPEPATWALMILGIAGVGGMVRRRRSMAVSATS